MKASLEAYDFRELHKKLDLNIINMGMSKTAQNS
jgi:hypothetical protein